MIVDLLVFFSPVDMKNFTGHRSLFIVTAYSKDSYKSQLSTALDSVIRKNQERL